jgi:deazaflavin-dependent oxidoreductase (nitroreductase family)
MAASLSRGCRDSMMRMARQRFMRAVDVLTQAAYRASGGHVGARQAGRDILLLTTVGRKSGRERTHALLFVRDGERYVVCGSNFGDARHPAWYLNLRAHPVGTAQIGPLTVPIVATEASGEERLRLWQTLLAAWPAYANYQAGVERTIPVIILTPRGAAPE